MKNKLDLRNLIKFLLIAFGFSWFFWIPKALVAQGIITQPFLVWFLDSPYNPAAMGPFVAAFLLVYKESGWEGVKALAKRGLDFRFHKKWLLPVLFLMPIISLVSYILPRLSENFSLRLEWLDKPWVLVYWFFYLLFLGGPLQEEFGWRGYALDILQSRYSALKSSLILGVIWTIWHLPLNFTFDVGPQYSIAISMIVGSLITMTLLSIISTWIYNNTGKSILTALLFHTSINFSSFILFPVFDLQESMGLYTLLILVTTIFIVILFGHRKLTK